MERPKREWDNIGCKLNRMVNYKMMRFLLGRKRSFISPFVDIISRGKLDRFNKLDSFVSKDTVEQLSKKLGMDKEIFSGENRFRVIEREGTDRDTVYLTESNWKQYIDFKKHLIQKGKDEVGNIFSDREQFIQKFDERLEKYLKEGLDLYDGKFNDMQLTRYVYFITHGYSYNENYLERKYKQLIIELNNSKINDIKLLDDKILNKYYQVLKKQIEKINAIKIFQEEGILPKINNVSNR